MWEQIKADEIKLGEFEQKIYEAERKLDDNRWLHYLSVVLAEGTKLEGRIDHVSDEHDLAVVQLVGDGRCPTIPVDDSDNLNQGNQLFTVDSPMGIRHTVTSGIFSDHMRFNGQMMLQTDRRSTPATAAGRSLTVRESRRDQYGDAEQRSGDRLCHPDRAGDAGVEPKNGSC